MQDFMAALKEVKPAFGAVVETLDSYPPEWHHQLGPWLRAPGCHLPHPRRAGMPFFCLRLQPWIQVFPHLNGITDWVSGVEHPAATCRTLVEQACHDRA